MISKCMEIESISNHSQKPMSYLAFTSLPPVYVCYWTVRRVSYNLSLFLEITHNLILAIPFFRGTNIVCSMNLSLSQWNLCILNSFSYQNIMNMISSIYKDNEYGRTTHPRNHLQRGVQFHSL